MTVSSEKCSSFFFTTQLPGLFKVYAGWQVSPYLCEPTQEPKTLLVARRLWSSSSQQGLSPSAEAAVDRSSTTRFKRLKLPALQFWNHPVHFILKFVSMSQTDKHQRVHVGRWEYLKVVWLRMRGGLHNFVIWWLACFVSEHCPEAKAYYCRQGKAELDLAAQ